MVKDLIVCIFESCVFIELRPVLVEVVDLGLLLLGERGLEEVEVLARLAVAEDQLVDLLLAVEQGAVALEEALLGVVEDGQAQRLQAHAELGESTLSRSSRGAGSWPPRGTARGARACASWSSCSPRRPRSPGGRAPSPGTSTARPRCS